MPGNRVMQRRDFIFTAGKSALACGLTASPFARYAMAALTTPDIRAVAFDAFPVFDPRSVLGLARSLFPAHDGFGQAWFNKIFAYTWLRTQGARYTDFHTITAQALDYTAAQYGQPVTTLQKDALMQAWFSLKLWPDVPAAIALLEQQNIRLAFLSNFTEEMLRANARAGGIENSFAYLSTDRVKAFKPAAQAYRMGVAHFGLPKENIAFCAFAAWDAVGASWFGYPTVWANRLGQQAEHLGQGTIKTGADIHALTHFVQERTP